MSAHSVSPVRAPPYVHALLDRLHALSISQEAAHRHVLAADHELRQADPRAADRKLDEVMQDKLVALDQDKCQFVYQLIRAIGATTVVEAGTSFGVSTIYLALAVGANGKHGKVIATEKEPSKAAGARRNWKEAGPLVEDHIELREGDLLETLKNIPEIDLLLLDIWAPLALPTLRVVQPKLKPGAVIITDNTIVAAHRYEDLLDYLRSSESPFTNLTLPYSDGLEMSVYSPSRP